MSGAGESMNQCMACWAAILPHTVRHPVVTTDLAGLLSYYQADSPAQCTPVVAEVICLWRPTARACDTACNGADRLMAKNGNTVPVTEICIVGSFDNLKSRHMRLLEEAAKLGPVHVLLLSDQLVAELTGQPSGFPEQERRYFVAGGSFREPAEHGRAVG